MKRRLFLFALLLFTFVCMPIFTIQASAQQRIRRSQLRIAGVPYNVSLSAAKDATANGTLVTVGVYDGFGQPVPFVVGSLWLSDATTGLGMTAVTASTTVGTFSTGTGTATQSGGCDAAAVVAGLTMNTSNPNGACLGVTTTKKALIFQTNLAGTYVLQINDSAKTLFSVCVQTPLLGTGVGDILNSSGAFLTTSANCLTLVAASYL